MALKRPGILSCEGFAALGPQLQTLAQAADTEMAAMSTGSILQALDSPAMTLSDTAAVSVLTGFIVNIPFAVVEFDNTNGLIVPSPIFGSAPVAARLPAVNPRQWYYVGLYLKTEAHAATTTKWKVFLNIQDADPTSSGVVNTTTYVRSIITLGGAATSFDYLWFEAYVPSGGGFIYVQAYHDAAVNLNVLDRRFWVMNMSAKR